jgi:hypothetical protein
MTNDKHGFVKVDDLMPQLPWQQACEFYGIDPGPVIEGQKEVRTRCFFNCGKTEETGNRAIAIDTSSPVKLWKCHQYGCSKGGNLVGMCDLMKPGANDGGRPKGARFKEVAADVRAMVGGISFARETNASAATKPATVREEIRVNVPLKDSENEHARKLVNLDAKLVTDVAEMNPAASAYFRERPYLTLEQCEKWRVGYLPRDAGGDRSGGTLRGKVVYGYRDRNGDVLVWFGRDPEHARKHQQWVDGNKEGNEPAKFHFVKGFHRGQQFYGEHALQSEAVQEPLQGIGLVIVEGPNDVIALDALGIPAVALCSNTITRTQAKRAAELAATVGGLVTLLLDCDVEGEKGAQQAVVEIAKHAPVRLGWASDMHDGKFRGRQPETLTPDEWNELREFLQSGA